MSLKPCVEKLPDLERHLMFNAFLNVVHAHPDLAHVRLLVRPPADRQLALIAALERSATRGTPLANPPHPDDHADALLCDILDALDHDPVTSNHGAYYGPDRHLVNLQALGIWNGDKPVSQPTALELFTTRFSDLTADLHSHLPNPGAINSPLLQDSTPRGELIALSTTNDSASTAPSSSPQTLDSVLVVAITPDQQQLAASSTTPGIIHHETNPPGEQITLSPSDIPSRPIRRGRPLLLDERAKGRILGLMAYGLSLRQAAAQLGLHHTTVLAALKRDEEFAEQVSEARLDAIAQPLITVVQASRRSWRAAAWLAKFLEDRNNKHAATTAPGSHG